MTTKRVRVLIVDDSAFARKVIREILVSDPDIEVVGSARDGLDALEKIAELAPDVVTLDLVMPDLDGLGVLRASAERVLPRFLVVSVSASDSEAAIEALQHGAVDVVTKPTPLPTARLYELAPLLIEKVKAVAQATPRSVASAPEISALPPLPASAKLVVIGTSTGGPQALTTFFQALPADFPAPIAVALHIPEGYTAPLASRISKVSRIKLEEACDGMELRAGRAVIAPGGRHLIVRREGSGLFAGVSREPRQMLYHPSVDLLFSSAAEALGPSVVAVVLTGMGTDGLAGASAIKAAGGRILAEARASCVVFGMPRAVLEANLTVGEAELSEMAGRVIAEVYRKCD